MATFTFEEQRVIIRFLHLYGMKPIEIHQQLSETCNDGVMDVENLRSWVQLQRCCRRKTGEHEPPDEERCRDERAQLQPFWAVFHAMLEETSFVTHLHKSHPSLLYSWERSEYHAFVVRKHGYHHHSRNHVFRSASA